MAGLNESAPMVCVKKEDLKNESPASYDLEEVAAPTIKIKQEEDEEPALPAATAAVDAPVKARAVDDESLVPLSPAQASQRPFPPNCPILCVTPISNVLGTVQAVFIDISSQTRKFVYRIIDKDSTTFIATEDQLQWGQSCPVWASLSTMPQVCQPCIVEAIYQKCRQSEPLYTLVAKDGSLHHLIPKHCISYRVEAELSQHGNFTMSNPANGMDHDDSLTPNPSTLPPASGTLTSISTTGTTTMFQQGAPIPRTLTLASGNLESNVASVETSRRNAQSTGGATNRQQQYGAPIPANTLTIARGHLASNVASVAQVENNHQDDGTTGHAQQVSDKQSRQSVTDASRAVTPTEDGIENPAASMDTIDEKTGSVKRSPNKREGSCKKQKVGFGNRFQPASHIDTRCHSRDPQVVPSEQEWTRDSRSRVEPHNTTDFVIPNYLFGVHDVKDFCRRATRNGAIRKLTTEFQLEDDPKRVEDMRIRLSGTKEDITEMSNKIEQLVYEAVDKDNKERALYALALRNKYRRSVDEAVHQYLYSLRMRGKKWMVWKPLRRDFGNYIGMAIGKNEKNTKRIMKDTNCVVNFNLECRDPHCFVYGDTVDDVRKCWREMRQRLQDAKADWESRQSQSRLLF